MRHDIRTITTDDHQQLFVEQWLPDTEPTAVVHVIHGMAEHAARYEHLAETLTARGWAVRVDDHRGHGRSVSASGTIGHFADEDGWEAIIQDQRALLDADRSDHPGLPIVVVGHSLGTAIARDVAIRWGGELAALVLSGTPAGVGRLTPVARAVANREAAKGPSRPSQRLHDLAFWGFNKPFHPNRTEFDWLSRDPDQVDAYVADPLCGFVSSAAFFRDVVTGLARVADLGLLRHIPADLPVLAQSGGKDPAGANGRGARAATLALSAAGIRDVTCVIHEGGRHEIFNETNRDEVMELTAGWIARHL